MLWKTLVLALFVVAVSGDEFELTDEKKEQIKGILRGQCKKANSEDKGDDVTQAAYTFFNCVKELVNVEQLKQEIEQAKPNGALDEVFKKYCAKTPQLKTCIDNVLVGISPCLEPDQKEYINDAKNGTSQLIDFVCYKDGDRIALFIAEHGPDCFQNKTNAIRECTQKLQSSLTSVESSKALSEKCEKFDEVTACIVTALEGCDTPTPGNMAESLFKFVRKGSPCDSALPKN